MKPRDALDAIHAILDGTEWDADTVAGVAEIVTAAGYTIRDPDEVDDEDDDEDEYIKIY